jgi:hypothetical protein
MRVKVTIPPALILIISALIIIFSVSSCTEKAKMKNKYRDLINEQQAELNKARKTFLEISQNIDSTQKAYFFCELVLCEGLNGKHNFSLATLAEVKTIKPKLDSEINSLQKILFKLNEEQIKRDSIRYQYENAYFIKFNEQIVYSKSLWLFN